MSEHISFAQTALAAVYASPFMAFPMVLVSNWHAPGLSPKVLAGPLISGALLLWIPTVLANVTSRALVGWLGAGLSPVAFHIMAGLVAAVVFVWIIDFVARSSANIGGGPLGWPMFFALVIAALCNAAMIYAVWHFGWKSTID
jgi:hypothetical protein